MCRANLLLLMLAGCVLAACQRSETEGTYLARRWLEALNSHDVEQVTQLLDGGATYSDPAPAQPVALPVLRQRLQQTWSVWKDQVYTANKVIEHADTVAIEWHVQQTHPSGRSVPTDGVTILEVQSSRIHAVRNYYNTGIYLQFIK